MGIAVERVCLTHGKVLETTESLDLRCPVGPHKVTRWGVGNRATRTIEDAADAEVLGTIDVKKAAAAARKEQDMPRGVPGSGPVAQPGATATGKAVKLASTRFTAGDEKLALKVVRNNAWGALPFRVLVSSVSGKTREKGVLHKASIETEAMREYYDEVAKAISLGRTEAGAGTLTSIPTPKSKGVRPRLAAAR